MATDNTSTESGPDTAASYPHGEPEPSTSRTHVEVDRWRKRVDTARQTIPLKSDPALYEEPSNFEVHAERRSARWLRRQWRVVRRIEVRSEVVSRKRDIKAKMALEREKAADARWHRRALSDRDRITSPASRLASVHKAATRSQRILFGVVIIGMVWAGVNVQHNLVPDGDMADPLFWFSYGVEAMISVPLMVIMMYARQASEMAKKVNVGQVVTFELSLLAITLALNVIPRIHEGDGMRALEYGTAPAMVGVVIWLQAWLSARYAELRLEVYPMDASTTEAAADHDPTPTAVETRPRHDGAELESALPSDSDPEIDSGLEVDPAPTPEEAARERRAFWRNIAMQARDEQRTRRDVEEVTEALMRHYDEFDGHRAIGRLLGVHHNTVGKILEDTEPLVPAELVQRVKNVNGDEDTEPPTEEHQSALTLLTQHAS